VRTRCCFFACQTHTSHTCRLYEGSLPVIAHISDMHLDESPAHLRRLKAVLDQIADLSNVDALLLSGDLADLGSPQEYEQLFSALPSAWPTLIVPGDHDLTASLCPGPAHRHRRPDDPSLASPSRPGQPPPHGQLRAHESRGAGSTHSRSRQRHRGLHRACAHSFGNHVRRCTAYRCSGNRLDHALRKQG